jgi:hypothetical protein
MSSTRQKQDEAQREGIQDANASATQTDNLTPWGTVLNGQAGVSATRLASDLGVPIRVVKRLASPVGKMKMPSCNPFDVYDPALAKHLRDHPDVVKARARRLKRQVNPTASGANIAVKTRRKRCVSNLSANRPDLVNLYEKLVERLWSLSTEKKLGQKLYAELPAMLWDAFAPKPGAESEAIEVIVDTIWAMTKSRTWKVNNEWGGQDVPLVWQVWQTEPPVDTNPEIYENVFAAAIRHLWFPDERSPKYERRELALEKLAQLSSRQWPSVPTSEDTETS